jgi:hypothetical protein
MAELGSMPRGDGASMPQIGLEEGLLRFTLHLLPLGSDWGGKRAGSNIRSAERYNRIE